MIESTTDIFSEMNSIEAELSREMSRELLQIRVNEASKCSKLKISKFQSVVLRKLQQVRNKLFTEFES